MQNAAVAPLVAVPSATWLDKQLLRELDNNWRKAYLYFGLALLLILGSALMVNPPTIATFIDSVGVGTLPIAQTYLPVVLLPILFFYNFLYSFFKQPAMLVLVMSLIYAVIYAGIGIRSLASDNKNDVEAPLAWILYYATNTKSVLFPVMFWSVMNDLSTAQMADGTSYSRVAYPTLVLAGQVGGILGSLIAANNSYLGGTPTLMIVQAVALIVAAALVWRGCKMATIARDARNAMGFDLQQPVAVAEEVAEVGAQGGCRSGLKAVGQKMWEVVEGIYIILTEPYVAGIFWVACAHLVPRAILDYQGTSVVDDRWPGKHNKDKQTAFFAWCNLANSVGTAIVAQFGLRKLVEKGGITLSLLACPIAMLVSVLVVIFHYDFWTVQIVLVVVNVVQYALNAPCREFLYVQTSKNIKYKAKSWSDMYGNFLQKTIAAQVNDHFNKYYPSCDPPSGGCFNKVATGFIVVGWVAVWGSVATALGTKNQRLVKRNEKVGENGVGCCRTGEKQ